MVKKWNIDLRIPLRFGLIAGLIALMESVIGIVTLSWERSLVANVVTMGQVMLFAPAIVIASMAAKQADQDKKLVSLLYGLVTGILTAIPLIILIAMATAFDLRQFMPNVSPALIELLTFGRSPVICSLILLGVTSLMGLLAAAFDFLPKFIQRPLLMGLIVTLSIGVFSEILSNRLRDLISVDFSRAIFEGKALKTVIAVGLFAFVAILNFLWNRFQQPIRGAFGGLPPRLLSVLRVILILGLIALGLLIPKIAGTYLSEVINNVGIFVLMGLGLNIVVGFAGLLDLGYVAFFAIGAYSMAVFTSEGPLGVSNLSFWAAIPFCIVIAAFAGIVLGVPVLRMRGDYLAIVTLGFGEIIRILALSDLLKPYIGGAQGVLKIPKPTIINFFAVIRDFFVNLFSGLPLPKAPFETIDLIKPDQFYYIVLVGCALAWFVSWRLGESRLGRQWMAVREDEDVAEAVGIKLVSTKLLAFAVGAAFSGLSGAFFASKLTSIFPHSFKLDISINVLCLIIIGGIGSLPGVVVGAIILVGMPELLREFKEYRLLMYGILLVVMMLARPEGFIPSAVKRREKLTVDEQIQATAEAESAAGD